MKKIYIIIFALFIGIAAVTWLYFKNLNSANVSNEQIFNVIPKDASLVFEYKNEEYFYEIFKDFELFKDILGKNTTIQLKALKQVFVDDKDVAGTFFQSDLFFSIHPVGEYKADVLIIAPIVKDFNNDDAFISILKSKYKITKNPEKENQLYQLEFNNKSFFNFYIHKNLIIGSFNEGLVKRSLLQTTEKQNNTNFKVDFNSVRNKNSIANLYISFAKLRDFANNFTNRKNPYETYALKSFDASASLNINYQSNAFMFSGITTPNLNAKNYYNLFLSQEPGTNTLAKYLPYDVANYSFYYVSNYKKFQQDLKELLTSRKELEKLKNQIENISSKHSINLDKEIIPVIGKEFGVFQLASGDNIGIIKTVNTNRLSFLLSTISSEVSDKIRHFDDSNILYNYFGDPFKTFKRPYYTTIENHLIVANNTTAIKRFINNYTKQNFLELTDKNIDFQQYLSNQGNIFYFFHNSNSKAILRSFLSKQAYKDYRSEDFSWTNIYGFAIQFSADKDKFYTNMYMNKTPESSDLLPKLDSTTVKF